MVAPPARCKTCRRSLIWGTRTGRMPANGWQDVAIRCLYCFKVLCTKCARVHFEIRPRRSMSASFTRRLKNLRKRAA